MNLGTMICLSRILHDNGFSEEEVSQQKAVVYNNTVQSMSVILKAMNTLEIRLEDPEREVRRLNRLVTKNALGTSIIENPCI